MTDTNLKIVAVIQARMGSTRLPQKVLKKILGKTLIELIYHRLTFCREIDQIVLSTSTKKENDILVKHAKSIGLRYYRGSEKDLISRLLGTAKKFRANAIVRITADCPLVDPGIVDRMVKIYREKTKRVDLVTNIFPPTFPDGLDIEILPFFTLKRLNDKVRNPLGREWLTYYIMENPKKFRIYNFKNPVNLSSMRLTIDYPEDLVFVSKVFKALDKKSKIFTMIDILSFLKKNPQLLKINTKRVDNFIKRGFCSGAYHALKKYE